jgi:NAD(P)-dependent dehydrogenase (short-subunit alcohol dehydrogenase family)
MNIHGAVVVVTGAAGGIGRALAVEAGQRGAAAVAIVDVNLEGARTVADDLRSSGVPASAYRCDISDFDAVETVADEISWDLGTPTLVCANAGVSPVGGPLLEAEAGDLSWSLAVNVAGTWATLRSFGRRLVASGQPGWLLVTASEHSLGVPFAGAGFYTATKHAVLGLADVLRQELPEQVGISALLPGLVNTELWRSPELRPESLGGPSSAPELARALLQEGVDPAQVARLALDGVASGRFLIATHPHAIRYAQARSADIDVAFNELALTDTPDTSYDAMELAAKFAVPGDR